MADEKNESFRDRVARDRDADREQIEGFFDTWKGRILAMIAVAVVVGFLGWNLITGIVTSITGG